MSIVWVIFGVFVALQVADYLTTVKAIALGGVEKMKLSKLALGKWGSKGILLVKALAVAVGAYLAYLDEPATRLVLAGVTAFYCFVVWSNLSVIKKLKKSAAPKTI